MTQWTERTVGYGLAIVGGGLILLGALLSGVVGAVDLAVGHLGGAAASAAQAVVLLVVGALAVLFAYLGYRPWSDRPIAAGVLLVVLGALAWGAMGFGSNLAALVGALLVLLGGVLYLVVPLERHVGAALAA
jgi:hypothetical protein